METSKKRHNPPIFEEDSAVKAFDRNNDAIPADSLDNLVKNVDTSKVQVVKNDSILSKELCNLLNKIVGIEETEMKKGYSAEEAFLSDYITLEKEQARKWYQKRKIEPYITIEVDMPPPRSSFEDAYTIRQFIHQGKYSPIKITAHTPDAVQKAKVFAAAYQELTKQNAIVVQNCEDVKEDLEQKTKEPSELNKTLRAVGREFGKDVSKIKDKLKNRKTLEGDAFNAMSTISIMPFCTYTGIKRLSKAWNAPSNERGGPLEPIFGLVFGMISTTIVSIYAGVQAYEGNYIPLAVVGTTQSLDTVGRYALNLWKRAKNG